MLSKAEFEKIFVGNGPKLKNLDRAYSAYYDLHKLIEENPEKIDELIQSCDTMRRSHRNALADMLIEVTPSEVDDLINIIELVKEQQ